jgi:hypothetical protein
MSNQADKTKAPEVDTSNTLETPADERLDRIADEAAQKAERTEKRFDSDHDIFTK